MDIEHTLLVLATHVRHLVATHHFWNAIVSRESSLIELDKLIKDLTTVVTDVTPTDATPVDVTK